MARFLQGTREIQVLKANKALLGPQDLRDERDLQETLVCGDQRVHQVSIRYSGLQVVIKRGREARG